MKKHDYLDEVGQRCGQFSGRTRLVTDQLYIRRTIPMIVLMILLAVLCILITYKLYSITYGVRYKAYSLLILIIPLITLFYAFKYHVIDIMTGEFRLKLFGVAIYKNNLSNLKGLNEAGSHIYGLHVGQHIQLKFKGFPKIHLAMFSDEEKLDDFSDLIEMIISHTISNQREPLSQP